MEEQPGDDSLSRRDSDGLGRCIDCSSGWYLSSSDAVSPFLLEGENAKEKLGADPELPY
jgi:hypothetical protein